MNGTQESSQRMPEARRLSQEALQTVPHRLHVGRVAAEYMQRCILGQYPPVEQAAAPAVGGQSDYMPADVANFVTEIEPVSADVSTVNDYGQFESPEIAAYFRDLEAQKRPIDA